MVKRHYSDLEKDDRVKNIQQPAKIIGFKRADKINTGSTFVI